MGSKHCNTDGRSGWARKISLISMRVLWSVKLATLVEGDSKAPLMSRVFTNGPGDWGSIPGWVIPKTQKNGTWCHLA